MALMQAASLTLEAMLEAASLVWMELAMFGLAAICYLFFVGLPGGLQTTGGHQPSTKGGANGKGQLDDNGDGDSDGARPGGLAASAGGGNGGCSGGALPVPVWEELAGGGRPTATTTLCRMVLQQRRSGKSTRSIVEELRAALEANPSLLTPESALALPGALLREEALDLAEATLKVLEDLEQGDRLDGGVYASLFAALLKRRQFGRLAALGGRLPEARLSPRLASILASGSAQRGALDEALQHLRSLPEAGEGEKFQLAAAVAVQCLDLAAKEARLPEVVSELKRLMFGRLDEKHAEQLCAAQLRRSPAAAEEHVEAVAGQQPTQAEAQSDDGGCKSLLTACESLGLGPEVCQSALVKAKAQVLASGSRSGGGNTGADRSGGSASEGQRAAAAIKAFAKDRNLEGAAQVFERVRAPASAAAAGGASPLVFNCFLDACVQCGDLDRAKAHFEEMRTLKVLDTVGYNTLLKGFLSRGQTLQACELVKEMSGQGLSANKVTYNELLHAAVVARDRQGMWAVVDEMEAAGVRPNAVTCSIVLKSLTHYGQAAELQRVSGLMEELEDPVDEVLFSSVIEACIRMERLELLTEMLKRFRQRGAFVRLSAPTYGSMIKAYGQAGDAGRVQELWTEMQEQGVKPTSITLGCLTEALVVNGKAEEAWALVREQMGKEEMRGSINTVIYSTVLKGFAVEKNLEKVFAVYDEMRSHDIACNTITYNTMLDACAKACAMGRASLLLEHMGSSCVEPDIITYSTIIKGYCLEGDVDRAFHVLEEMKKDGKFRPDEIMYNSILDGCAKQHRVEDGLKVLDEMKEAKISPSNYTLSILVKVLGHARRLGQAFEMVESLSKQNGFRPNVQVYTCLVQACVHNRKLERAMSLHDTMVADVGCTVDEKFYAVLVRGCLQLRQPLKAVDVVQAAFQLPNCKLAHSARRDGRPVGLDVKALDELASRLQGGSREEQEAWAELSRQLPRLGSSDGHGGAKGASKGSSKGSPKGGYKGGSSGWAQSNSDSRSGGWSHSDSASGGAWRR